MLIANIIYYNEEENIDRCLNSIINKVDKINLIDGAYKDFRQINNSFLSTDKSYNIINKFNKNKINLIIPEKPWTTEIEKRNEYLKHANTNDIMIVIDADEELIGTINKDKIIDNIYDIIIKRVEDETIKYPIFRLFKHNKDLKYIGTHHALHEGEILLNKLDKKIIDDFYLLHYSSLRNGQRNVSKSLYYQKLKEQEIEFRELNNL